MGVIRGQIWLYVTGSQSVRVLIVSNDEYNDDAGFRPWGLLVQRTGAEGPLAIRIAAGEPEAGALIKIPLLYRVDPTAVRENLGFVSNDTMNAVEYGLREFLVLP